jgi:holin-like protein
MLLLALFLQLGWIKLAWVKGLSNLLIGNMGFFFIPPGVAVMLYFDLIKSEWLAITLSTIASIIVVMWITGWSYKATRIIQRRFKTYKKNGKHI